MDFKDLLVNFGSLFGVYWCSDYDFSYTMCYMT